MIRKSFLNYREVCDSSSHLRVDSDDNLPCESCELRPEVSKGVKDGVGS